MRVPQTVKNLQTLLWFVAGVCRASFPTQTRIARVRNCCCLTYQTLARDGCLQNPPPSYVPVVLLGPRFFLCAIGAFKHCPIKYCRVILVLVQVVRPILCIVGKESPFFATICSDIYAKRRQRRFGRSLYADRSFCDALPRSHVVVWIKRRHRRRRRRRIPELLSSGFAGALKACKVRNLNRQKVEGKRRDPQ